MPGTPYSEAVSYLFGLQRHGIKLGLESMQRLLHALGAPHHRVRTFHIGGTNGKGSTAALTASILQAAGLRVGLYTSPHLVDFRERIQIDGTMIGEDAVGELTACLRRDCPSDLAPTFFEFTTAMALQYFADRQVDLAVLEVGMGGRFDATNVVTPAAACITTVAMDHEAYLGHDLRAIAFEKAGIVKPGVPIVIGAVAAEARTVIAEAARARGARMGELGVDFSVEGVDPSACVYRSPGRAAVDLSCPLRGRHQLDNLGCAVALVDAAEGLGSPITDDAVRRGVACVRWPGRLELVGDGPRLLLDGAHNPAAAAVVGAYLASFRLQHPSAKVWLVLGMMQDKDHTGFLRPLLPHVDEAIVTVPQLARAAPAETLCASFPARGPAVRVCAAVPDAIRQACRSAASDDLICVTGSLMLVGEAKASLQGSVMSPLRG